MRLVTLAISIVVVVVFAALSGSLHPTAWYTTTRYTGIFLVASVAVVAVVLIIEKAAKNASGATLHVVMLGALFVGANLLLCPVYLLRALVNGYVTTVQEFITILNTLQIPSTVGDVQPLLTAVHIASIVLIGLLIVGGVVLLAAVVLLVVWLVTPRSLGWIERQVINVALMTPPAMLLICCAGVVFLTKYAVPQVEKKLGLTDLPASTVLPGLAISDDWLVWMLMAFSLLTVAMAVFAAAKLTTANILRARLPQGNALRVDALGLVVDDIRGPQRVKWTENTAIAGRQRGNLPGPELVINRPGGRPWSVPFMYLDVMPGTVDSALRAATGDARTLDLAPLDKVF